jgi:hypothetical protein
MELFEIVFKGNNLFNIESVIKMKQAIYFEDSIQLDKQRPGFLSWMLLGVLLLLCYFLVGRVHFYLWATVVGMIALIYLPALAGSLAGWFLGSIWRELKDVLRALKLLLS